MICNAHQFGFDCPTLTVIYSLHFLLLLLLPLYPCSSLSLAALRLVLPPFVIVFIACPVSVPIAAASIPDYNSYDERRGFIRFPSTWSLARVCIRI